MMASNFVLTLLFYSLPALGRSRSAGCGVRDLDPGSGSVTKAAPPAPPKSGSCRRAAMAAAARQA